MSPRLGTTETTKNGHTNGTIPTRPGWLGIVGLEENPIPKGVEGFALYSELWSKIRWALGGTFGMPYGKQSPWVGELSRRLTLLILANRPDKS